MSYLVLARGKPASAIWDEDEWNERPALEGGYLRKVGDAWELVVTDSYVCAILSLEYAKDDEPEPTEGPIGRGALEAISRHSAFRATEDQVVAFSPSKGEAHSFTRHGIEKYPDVDALFKDEATAFSVRLDARLLKRLADAFGEDGLELEYVAPNKPVRVRPLIMGGTVDEKRRGLIMPIRKPGT